MASINWILHTGQTGVERGAWNAVQVLREEWGISIGVGGVGPKDPSKIPQPVRVGLRPSSVEGPYFRTAVLRQVFWAVLVVPNRLRPEEFPSIRWVLESRDRTVHWVVVDQQDSAFLSEWLCRLPRFPGWGSVSGRLYVTGPTATEWPEGEKLTQDLLVRAFAPVAN